MWLHKNNLVFKYCSFCKKKDSSYEIRYYFNVLFLIKLQLSNKRGNPHATGKTSTDSSCLFKTLELLVLKIRLITQRQS